LLNGLTLTYNPQLCQSHTDPRTALCCCCLHMTRAQEGVQRSREMRLVSTISSLCFPKTTYATHKPFTCNTHAHQHTHKHTHTHTHTCTVQALMSSPARRVDQAVGIPDEAPNCVW